MRHLGLSVVYIVILLSVDGATGAKVSAFLTAEEGRVIDNATTNVRQVGKPTNQVALASQQADKPGSMVCHTRSPSATGDGPHRARSKSRGIRIM